MFIIIIIIIIIIILFLFFLLLLLLLFMVRGPYSLTGAIFEMIARIVRLVVSSSIA